MVLPRPATRHIASPAFVLFRGMCRLDTDGRPVDGTTVRGVVAVLRRGAEILMIQRADGIKFGGAWCFPGGAIEPGETSSAALVRELREELALDVQPDRAVWRWVREDGRLEIEWWLADIVAGSPDPNPAEVQRAEWMTVRRIRETRGVLENNLEFLDYAEQTRVF